MLDPTHLSKEHISTVQPLISDISALTSLACLLGKYSFTCFQKPTVLLKQTLIVCKRFTGEEYSLSISTYMIRRSHKGEISVFFRHISTNNEQRRCQHSHNILYQHSYCNFVRLECAVRQNETTYLKCVDVHLCFHFSFDQPGVRRSESITIPLIYVSAPRHFRTPNFHPQVPEGVGSSSPPLARVSPVSCVFRRYCTNSAATRRRSGCAPPK